MEFHHPARSEAQEPALVQSDFSSQTAGFFVADESDVPASWATEGWATLVHAPALPVAHAQFFRVDVSSALRVERHFVVFAHYPRMTPQQCHEIVDAVRKVFPDAVISFLLDDGEGQATVRGTPTVEAAYAVALAKFSCGWDESDPIQVNFDPAHFQVRLTNRDRVHFGSVTETPTRE